MTTHTETSAVGMKLRAFNRFSLGVLHDAVVTKVWPDRVTLFFPVAGRREVVRKDRPEWFVYPPGHERAGEFFVFT